MESHGIGTRDQVSKDLNVHLILRGAPYTPQEQERILDYCEEELADTIQLFELKGEKLGNENCADGTKLLPRPSCR